VRPFVRARAVFGHAVTARGAPVGRHLLAHAAATAALIHVKLSFAPRRPA